MRRRNALGSWGLLAAALAGCGSFEDLIGTDREPAPSADGGTPPAIEAGAALTDAERATLRMRSCNLVQPSASEIDRAVEAAAQRVLAQYGARAAVDPWNDQSTFGRLLTAVEDQLVCETSAKPLMMAAVGTAAVDSNPCYTATGGQVPGNRYCGPFCNGDNPVNSEILNDACYRHDVCYEKVQDHTGVEFPRECTFSPLTADCDRPFYELCELVLTTTPFPANDRIACRIAGIVRTLHADNCKDPCNVFGRWESSCPALTKCPAATSPAQTKQFEIPLDVAGRGGLLPSGITFDLATCSLVSKSSNEGAAKACGVPLDLRCRLSDGGSCPRLAYSHVPNGPCTCTETVSCLLRRPGLPR